MLALHQSGGLVGKMIQAVRVGQVGGTTWTDGQRHGMAIVPVPSTGGITQVGVAYDSNPNEQAIGLWLLRGASTAAVASSYFGGSDGQHFLDLVVPDGGLSVISGTRLDPTAINTTGAVEDYDQTPNGDQCVGARTTTYGAQRVVFDAVSSMVAYTFAPAP